MEHGSPTCSSSQNWTAGPSFGYGAKAAKAMQAERSISCRNSN